MIDRVEVLAVPVLCDGSKSFDRIIEIFFRNVVCPEHVANIRVDSEVLSVNQSVQQQPRPRVIDRGVLVNFDSDVRSCVRSLGARSLKHRRKVLVYPEHVVSRGVLRYRPAAPRTRKTFGVSHLSTHRAIHDLCATPACVPDRVVQTLTVSRTVLCVVQRATRSDAPDFETEIPKVRGEVFDLLLGAELDHHLETDFDGVESEAFGLRQKIV